MAPHFPTLKFLTLNINKITTPWKVQVLDSFLQGIQADIVLLQEVATYAVESLRGFQVVTNIDPIAHSGTAIALRLGMDFSDVDRIPDGRGIALTVNGLRLINVYAPSGGSHTAERAQYFNETVAKVIKGSHSSVIMGGDFNCVITPTEHSAEVKKCQALTDLTKCLALRDTWEYLHPHEEGSTYFHYRGSSRLDRFYISKTLLPQLLSAEVTPISISDHCSYHMCLLPSCGLPERPRQYWKCNTGILGDCNLSTLIHQSWECSMRQQNNYPSKIEWWTRCAKPLLRKTLIAHSQELAFWRRQTLTFYYQCLRDAHVVPDMPDNLRIRSIMRLKAKLLKLQQAQYQGLIIRSKPPGFIREEQPSIYHLNRERKRAKKHYISEISGPQNDILHNRRDVMGAVYQHFEALFTATPSDDHAAAALFENVPQLLTDADNANLTAPVTTPEVTRILRSCNKDKSPGPDGLPIEFYLQYWDVIGEQFTEVINEVLDGVQPPKSFLKGQIVLIHKGGTKRHIENYRPVTLLNSDYKLVSKCLVLKFKVIMPKIISPRQTCAVPGRNIFEATMIYRDVIAFSADANLSAAALLLDFHKAFDRINHAYLQKVMEHLGFSQSMVTVVQNLLRSATSTILVNGHHTKSLPLRTSVRQGCPMSMTLFAIALDPLLRTLDRNLRGIDVHGIKSRCIAYADDVGIFLQHAEDLPVIHKILRTFECASGAKLNAQKTVLLPLGAGFSSAPSDWFIPTIRHKVLGIYLQQRPLKMFADTWKDHLCTLRAIAFNNSGRSLNILERVQFANNVLYAKAWYLAQTLPVPRLLAASMASAGYWFVWRGEIFKLPRSTSTNAPTDGGIGMLDFHRKCVALFLHRMTRIIEDQPLGISARLIRYHRPASEYAPILVRQIPFRLSHLREYYFQKSYIQELFRTTSHMTASQIYRALCGTPCTHRFETQQPQYAWKVIWQNLHLKHLNTTVRTTWLKVINRIFRTRQKMYDIRQATSPLCERCAVPDTIDHRFNCGPTTFIWARARRMLALILRTDSRNIPVSWASYPELKPFPQAKRNAAIWILGHTVHFIFTYPDSTPLEYALYLAEEHSHLKRRARYSKTFCNFLKIALSIRD